MVNIKRFCYYILIFEARGIEDALNKLDVGKADKHPEKRVKAVKKKNYENNT